ncbi:ADP-ribosylglycohydrolase family protein [Candidatus Bathyarchaeota archaeon]|nr:ADP-ribosylglycohydrolase family protein [Candidatus Bathyarchaeota archaeon]
MKSKFIGCLLGVAIGDALGAFIEGLNKINYKDWIKRIKDAEVLTYTDDTHMTIGVTESLIKNKGFNGEDMAETFIKNYESEPYRGYGPGPPKVFKFIKSGKAWNKASEEIYPGGSFGNGAVLQFSNNKFSFIENYRHFYCLEFIFCFIKNFQINLITKGFSLILS